ncbi:MAG: ribonuclease Z [Candidatus Nanohaloarchaeota archaeon QJJ-7]|nr:ribonuclease Z [Candidatus Nanohaloarchaeota archaeon QJJ-7]
MIDLHTLGTSSAVPTSRRDLAANLLNFEGERLLFDCGEGAQKSIMKLQIGLMDIEKVFITHWHADHFSGLLGLVQTLSMEGRERTLHVYGPERTGEFTDQMLNIGYFDRSYEVVGHALEEDEVVEGDGYEVRPFKVQHSVPAYGYVFKEDEELKVSKTKMEDHGLESGPEIGKVKNGETVEIDGEEYGPGDLCEKVPGRKIVYTGDTAAHERIVEAAEGADVLIHEATVTQEMLKGRASRHSSSLQAAEMAKRADVDKLILTHFSRMFDKDPSPLLEEAQEVFEDTELAEDGKHFGIEPHRPESEKD